MDWYQWNHHQSTVYADGQDCKRIENIIARPETFTKGQNDHKTKKNMAYYAKKKKKPPYVIE